MPAPRSGQVGAALGGPSDRTRSSGSTSYLLTAPRPPSVHRSPARTDTPAHPASARRTSWHSSDRSPRTPPRSRSPGSRSPRPSRHRPASTQSSLPCSCGLSKLCKGKLATGLVRCVDNLGHAEVLAEPEPSTSGRHASPVPPFRRTSGWTGCRTAPRVEDNAGQGGPPAFR